MSDPPTRIKQFGDIIRMIFKTQDEDITCGECFENIDRYVDMLRAGDNPAAVLPQVERHLEQCGCCQEEFEALIAILEAETGGPHEPSTPDAHQI